MQSGELPAHKTRCQKGGQDCFAEYFSQLLLLISAPSGTNSLQPCTDGILQKQMPEQAQESSFGGCYA